MKNEKKDEKESTIACSNYEEPDYPYGLNISLQKEQLEKLDIKELPKVGSKMMMTIAVEVSSISSRQHKDEDHKCMDLQITDIEIGKEKESKAKILYGEED